MPAVALIVGFVLVYLGICEIVAYRHFCRSLNYTNSYVPVFTPEQDRFIKDRIEWINNNPDRVKEILKEAGIYHD